MTVCAVFALSAAGASTASAAFNSEARTTSVYGVNTTNFVLTTSLGTITCKKATYSDEMVGSEPFSGAGFYASETISFLPTYSECTAFGFAGTVNSNGCEYILSSTGYNGSGLASGPVRLQCPAGKKMVMTLFGCSMEFPSQNFQGAASYKNEGTGSERRFTMQLSLSGVTVEGSCGSGTKGQISGSSLVRGAGPTGIWASV